MMLASAGSGLPIIWIVIGALLVIRVAIGLRRRNRRQHASAPVPSPAPPALDAIRPVAAPTATDRTTLLEVRELTVAYGSKVAVDGVSFEIRRSEIFGLLGPNGAGKTTTLSAIEGLRRPRSGTVLLNGVDIVRQPAPGQGPDGSAAAVHRLPVRADRAPGGPSLRRPLRRGHRVTRTSTGRWPTSVSAASWTGPPSRSRAASSSGSRSSWR